MEIILLERIEKLGHMGDIVRVKDGYARNFLLPQKKALRATKENKSRFEADKEALQKVNDDKRTQAEQISEKVNGKTFILIRQAGDTMQLFGSVTARDIANTIAENGALIKRQQVRLDQPIKTLGIHSVQLTLHPEVIVTVKVNVARSIEEADIQKSGGDIESNAENLDDSVAIGIEVFDSKEAASEAAAELIEDKNSDDIISDEMPNKDEEEGIVSDNK